MERQESQASQMEIFPPVESFHLWKDSFGAKSQFFLLPFYLWIMLTASA